MVHWPQAVERNCNEQVIDRDFCSDLTSLQLFLRELKSKFRKYNDLLDAFLLSILLERGVIHSHIIYGFPKNIIVKNWVFRTLTSR